MATSAVASVGRVRAADRHAVAGRAASAAARNSLAEHRDVHDAGEQPVAVARGDRDGVAGQAVEEVRRAVDRVDEPVDAARAGVVGALLADDAVVGAGGEDAVDDERLGLRGRTR